MLRNLFVCLCILGLGFVAEAKKLSGPRVTCNGDVCIKNHGQSGKFSVSRGNQTENATNTITIEFGSIKEVDADGNEVGKTGGIIGKHSFYDFTSLNFDFTDVVETTYKGISAKAFNFSAKLPGPSATLNVPIYFFSDNGTVDICDDEEIGVNRGIMKFNIELSNWNFCTQFAPGDHCWRGQIARDVGKYLEFRITVKNKGEVKKGTKNEKQPGKKRRAQKFFFGNNSISFPSALMSDNSCTEMPEDYPKLETKGSIYNVTFRFPLFTDKVIYDPAVNVMESSSPEGSPMTDATSPTNPPGPSPTDGCSTPLPSFTGVLFLGALLCLFF